MFCLSELQLWAALYTMSLAAGLQWPAAVTLCGVTVKKKSGKCYEIVRDIWISILLSRLVLIK